MRVFDGFGDPRDRFHASSSFAVPSVMAVRYTALMSTINRTQVISDVTLLYYQALAVVRILALIRAADSVLATPRAGSRSEEVTMLKLAEFAMLYYVAIRLACSLDTDREMVCLPRVFDALSDEAVCAAILDYPTSFRSRQERERHLEKARHSWSRISADPRRDLLRRARSHALAHNLFDKTVKDVLGGAVLPFQDLADYAEECASLVGELASACLGTSEIDSVRAEAPQAADRIWRSLSSIL